MPYSSWGIGGRDAKAELERAEKNAESVSRPKQNQLPLCRGQLVSARHPIHTCIIVLSSTVMLRVVVRVVLKTFACVAWTAFTCGCNVELVLVCIALHWGRGLPH